MRSLGTLKQLLRSAPVPHGVGVLDRVACLHRLHQIAKAELEAARTEDGRRQAEFHLELARSGLAAIGVTVASDVAVGGLALSIDTVAAVPAVARQEIILQWTVPESYLVAAFRPLTDISALSRRDGERYDDIVHRSRFWHSPATMTFGCFEKSAPRKLHRALDVGGFKVVHRGVVPNGLEAVVEVEGRTVDPSYSQEIADDLPAGRQVEG